MNVIVTGEEIDERELQAYVDHARQRYGDALEAVAIDISKDEAALTYRVKGRPFERIRRITGYLVGTLDKWNDAKRTEERERVKHYA